MKITRTGSQRGWVACLAGSLVLASLSVVLGQETQVSASIEPAVVRVGEQAVYRIVISGRGALEEIPDIQAPATLEFGRPGQQKNVSIINGVLSVRGTLNYAVMPTAAGEFEIPGQAVTVGGVREETNAVRLTVKPARVGGAGAASGKARPGQENTASGQGGRQEDEASKGQDLQPFLGLEVGKASFYVGEIVPVTVTLYTHSSTPLRDIGMPQMDRSEFVLREFPRRPLMQVAQRGGVTYYSSVFSSSLSGIRPGKAVLGPVSVECIVQIPDRRIGLHPFLNLGRTKRFRVFGDSAELTVLPLPAEGRPEGFGGLVGEFSLSTVATPVKLSVGDPISLTMTLRGRGNLDEVEAPRMSGDSVGWKTYEPSVLGEPEGDAHADRRIAFNHVLIPTTAQKEIPSFSLPYFDPEKGEYVVLRSEPIAIEVAPAEPLVQGGAEAGASAPVYAGDIAPSKPTASLTDVVDYGGVGLAAASPSLALPPHRRTVFLAWQVLPLLMLLLLLVDIARRGAGRLAAGRVGRKDGARVSAEIADLRGFRGDRLDFLQRAAALARNLNSNGQDDSLKEIVAAYEVLQFGEGVGSGNGSMVDDEEQQRMVGLLAKAFAGESDKRNQA